MKIRVFLRKKVWKKMQVKKSSLKIFRVDICKSNSSVVRVFEERKVELNISEKKSRSKNMIKCFQLKICFEILLQICWIWFLFQFFLLFLSTSQPTFSHIFSLKVRKSSNLWEIDELKWSYKRNSKKLK